MSRAWHKMKRRLRQLEESAGVQCEEKLKQLRRKHEAELSRRTEKVESLLEKIAATNWRYDDRHGSYVVSISMNPDVMGGVSPYRDDMRFLAEMIGRQVEREIASGYFVEASMYERRRLVDDSFRRPHR